MIRSILIIQVLSWPGSSVLVVLPYHTSTRYPGYGYLDLPVLVLVPGIPGMVALPVRPEENRFFFNLLLKKYSERQKVID